MLRSNRILSKCVGGGGRWGLRVGGAGKGLREEEHCMCQRLRVGGAMRDGGSLLQVETRV